MLHMFTSMEAVQDHTTGTAEVKIYLGDRADELPSVFYTSTSLAPAQFGVLQGLEAIKDICPELLDEYPCVVRVEFDSYADTLAIRLRKPHVVEVSHECD